MESCQVGTAQASTESLLIAEVEGDRCLFYNNTENAFKPPEDSDDWVVLHDRIRWQNECVCVSRL